MAQSTPQISYVLFDLDGLMIDSERIYTDVTNLILAKYGKEMTWDIKAGCMGKPERAAAEYLLSFFPDLDMSLEDYLKQRVKLQDERFPTVPLLPGVIKLVSHLKANNIPMAIATGSRRRNYELKTAHLQEVFGLFEGKVVCADDAHYQMKGKPAPDIFIVAAREMLSRDVGPTDGPISENQQEERRRGLVFEDGLPGLQAGKKAGMSVVWVPDPNLLNVGYSHGGQKCCQICANGHVPLPNFDHLHKLDSTLPAVSGAEKADQVLKTLEDFVPEQWGLPPYPLQ